MQLRRSKLGTVPTSPEGLVLAPQHDDGSPYALRVALESVRRQPPYVVLGFQAYRA